MRPRAEDMVVVITGASRGIGRATARRFAERGASVVLAARLEDALLEAAAECEALGGKALAVPTDVAQWGHVEELERRAAERFGRIDVWVNNAVLAALGRLEEVPPEANRRGVEADLLGYVHGAQAALPRFREQGSGVLINMSSGFGLVGAPYAGAYTATKFAQRGLLRKEPAESSSGNLNESSAEWASADGGFNRDAKRRAALRVRRAVVAGASVIGPGILTWVLLRKGQG